MLKERTKRELSKTLDIYRNVAVAISSFPKGEKTSIKDLAEKANVHWNTAKKALIFFHKIGPLVPRFEIIEETLRFEVKEKPSAIDAVEGIFESREMRILTKMMLAKVTEPEKAKKLDSVLTTAERSFLAALIERGYVNSINGNYYLSKRGQSIGSMGLRKIVELNIPLPWETERRQLEMKRRHPSRLQEMHRYKKTLNAPKPIFTQPSRQPDKTKFYVS